MTTVQGVAPILLDRDAGVADAVDGPGPAGEEGKVESVVKKWLVYEDGVIANQLQEEEIRQHYGFNRQTRQTVRGDIPVAKELQTDEQQEAALARQRQLDELRRRTENDERIAREMNERLVAQEERERARRWQRQQVAQLSSRASMPQASAAVPSLSARSSTPPEQRGYVLPASSRTALQETRGEGSLTDEELARQIQAHEQERYLRRKQADQNRRQAADHSHQQRPRSDGAALTEASGASVPGAGRRLANGDERARAPEALSASRPGADAARDGGRASGVSTAAPLARSDVRRHSGGAELTSWIGRQERRRLEDKGDFGDFYLPPEPGMSEDECRLLQEQQDAEIARLLQEQEHKRTAGDTGNAKLKQLEKHDAELARIMQEEEKLRAQRRAIKQRQKVLQQARGGGVTGQQLPQQQQQLISAERPAAGEGQPSRRQTGSGYRGADEGQQNAVPNGSRSQSSRGVTNGAGHLPTVRSSSTGEAEGHYDSPWDMARVEDQLLRLRGTESLALQGAADESRLGSTDRSNNSGLNIAEAIDPTYKRRSREFQKRLSGDFTSQSRALSHLSGDLLPPAPTQPAPPPPSLVRPPAVIAQKPGTLAQPSAEWAPVPGQRRSQRQGKSKKGNCKQQ